MAPTPLTTIRQDRWRNWALALLALGAVGTLVELLLLKHFEDVWQFAPLAIDAAFLIAIGWLVRSRSTKPVWFLRAVSVVASISALVGIYFHLRANVEWELETTPDMRGLELVREVATGALPLLAPGAMLQLGLLGLLCTWRHPRFFSPSPHGAFPLET